MSDTVQFLDLYDLHESPFNPRRHFDDQALQELAESIRHEGILQPLLVRPRVPALFQSLADAADTAACGWEVVFGHRRYRAAALAQLERVPCIVRAMTDEEAKRAQIAENLQRKDVHPIEEAEGFQALLDEHQVTADDVAVQFGKSRSYVYGRLKLLQACPAVRKACLAGEIGSEVALLIARLRVTALQEKALTAISNIGADVKDGGARSYRRIRDLLNEKFTLQLKGAIFDIEDEMLVPAAGHCVRCPKRTGNAPEFEDVATADGKTERYTGWGMRHTGPDVCTDPDCFDAKKKAHLKREADKLAQAGKVVVAGNKARAAIDACGRLKDGFVPVADVREALKKAKGTKVDVLHVQDPRTGKVVQAVKQADLVEAGVKAPAAKSSNTRSASDRYALEQRAREAAAELETKVRKAVLVSVRERVRQTERSVFDLRIMALNALESMESDVRELLEQLQGKDWDALYDAVVQTLTADELSLLMLDIALLYQVEVDCWDLQYNRAPATALMEAAQHYGVDVAAIRADLAPPPPAKPQKKPKGKAAATPADQPAEEQEAEA